MDFADQIVITEVWIVLILLLWEVWRLKKEIKRVLNIVNVNQAGKFEDIENLKKEDTNLFNILLRIEKEFNNNEIEREKIINAIVKYLGVDFHVVYEDDPRYKKPEAIKREVIVAYKATKKPKKRKK